MGFTEDPCFSKFEPGDEVPQTLVVCAETVVIIREPNGLKINAPSYKGQFGVVCTKGFDHF